VSAVQPHDRLHQIEAETRAMAAIGIVLFNGILLTIGFALHRTIHDPLNVGGWLSSILVGAKITIVSGVRVYRGLAHGNSATSIKPKMVEVAATC
jgi:hypothetical protein